MSSLEANYCSTGCKLCEFNTREQKWYITGLGQWLRFSTFCPSCGSLLLENGRTVTREARDALRARLLRQIDLACQTLAEIASDCCPREWLSNMEKPADIIERFAIGCEHHAEIEDGHCVASRAKCWQHAFWLLSEQGDEQQWVRVRRESP